MPAPGWHPDPSGAHDLRYWDGQAWTGHVRDHGGSPPAPPLPAAAPSNPLPRPAPPVPAPAAQPAAQPSAPVSQPLLDTVITQWPRQPRRLVLDERGLRWGETFLPLHAVTAVAYKATKLYVNGVPSSTTYEFHAWGGQQHVKIVFASASVSRGQKKAEQEQNYHLLLTGSSLLIEPRLTEDLLQRVLRGDTVDVGGVEVSRMGVERSGLMGAKRLGWDEVAGTALEQGHVRVLVHRGQRTKPAFSVPMSKPNAVLLPNLLEGCAQARHQALQGGRAAG